MHWLLIPVMTAHLMAVGTASFLPLVCLWLERRETKTGDRFAGEFGIYLAWLSLKMTALGVALGGVALGILWLNGTEQYFQAWKGIPARRLWFAPVELLFYVLCMWGYGKLWERRRAEAENPTGQRPGVRRLLVFAQRLLGILAATDLLYHFPVLFAVVATLSITPDLAEQSLGSIAFMKIALLPETALRIAHDVTASMVVTGVMMMGYTLRCRRLSRSGPTPKEGKGPFAKAAIWGGRMSLAGAFLQLPLGVALLVYLPQSVRDAFMEGDWPATIFFMTGLAAIVSLLHHLLAVGLGDTGRTAIIRCMMLISAIMLLMVGARYRGRESAWQTRRPVTVGLIFFPGNKSGIQNGTSRRGHFVEMSFREDVLNPCLNR